MTRFPINPLLYLLIVGLLGGSGWFFYEALTAKKVPDQTVVNAGFDRVKRGQEMQADVKGPDYSDRAFWENLAKANFIGKLPPKPVVEEKPDEVVKAPETSKTPLKDIIVLSLLMHDGDESRIALFYKPEANVEPPEAAKRLLFGGGPGDTAAQPAANPRPNRPSRPGRAAPAVPTFNPNASIPHIVKVDETLWPPYEHIRLVRVAADCSHAYFVRDGGGANGGGGTGGANGETPEEEKLYKEFLELSQEVIEKLRDGGIEAQAGTRARDVAKEPEGDWGWVPTEETKKVGKGEWHVGTRDREYFRRNAKQVFSSDLGVSTYRGKHASGLKVTKVSSRLARYGVSVGDVIISVNGQAVKSKSQAYNVGKKQYRKGTRVFQIEVLSRGRRETRTVVAPKD